MFNLASADAVQACLDLGDLNADIALFSRQSLIATGALTDVTATAKEAGFCYPVAITTAVWNDCVMWSFEDSQRQVYQDEGTRLWFLLLRASTAIRLCRVPQATIYFTFYRLARNGCDRLATPCEVKITCSVGDGGDPVVTLYLHDEY